MNEVYEALGREHLRLELLRGEYHKLLGLVARIQAGEIEPGQVAIDLNTDSWRLLAVPVPAPAEPPTPSPEQEG